VHVEVIDVDVVVAIDQGAGNACYTPTVARRPRTQVQCPPLRPRTCHSKANISLHLVVCTRKYLDPTPRTVLVFTSSLYLQVGFPLVLYMFVTTLHSFHHLSTSHLFSSHLSLLFLDFTLSLVVCFDTVRCVVLSCPHATRRSPQTDAIASIGGIIDNQLPATPLSTPRPWRTSSAKLPSGLFVYCCPESTGVNRLSYACASFCSFFYPLERSRGGELVQSVVRNNASFFGSTSERLSPRLDR
jgi:hypothetical protein